MSPPRDRPYGRQYVDVFGAIEPTLRGHLGGEWNAVSDRLTIIGDLDDDDDARRFGELLVEEIEVRWPGAAKTLVLALESERLLYRSTFGAPRSGGPPTALAPARVARFADASYSPLIKLGKKVPITFTLRVEAPEPGAQPIELEVGKVVVRLIAPGFDVIGPSAHDLDLPAEGDSEAVAFQVKPRAAGNYELRIYVEQGGNAVASIPLPIEVVTDRRTAPEQTATGPVSFVPATFHGADNVLYIHHYKQADGSVWLHFLWLADGKPLGGPDLPLGNEPQGYASRLYESLVALSRRSDPGTAAAGVTTPLSRAAIERKLGAIGRELWKLLPDGIRRYCWEHRDALKASTLMIATDEPYIPWELVWPWDDAGDGVEAEAPWCLSFDLARWCVSRGTDHIGWRSQLELQRAAIFRPTDANLPHAAGEEARVTAALRGGKADVVPPPRLSYEGVCRFLADASYDWIHVASHGLRIAGDGSGSVLVLENNETLEPRDVSGEVAANIRKNHPAFVFNACDSGQRTFELTQIGGWAERLIGCGASLFLGTMWPVDDGQAARFTDELYQQILRGRTIGAALRAAREAIRMPGEITWLAYTLYAHPNAVVVLPP